MRQTKAKNLLRVVFLGVKSESLKVIINSTNLVVNYGGAKRRGLAEGFVL